MKKDEWSTRRIPVPLSSYVKETKRRTRKRVLSEEEMEGVVRKVCSGDLIGDREEVSSSVRMSHRVAQVFADKFAFYYDKRRKNWKAVVDNNRGVLGCCSRAAAQADILSCSIEDYVESQFWFFNKVFGRPPTYPEIASQGAILRYKKWRVARYHDDISRETVDISVGGYSDPRETEESVIIRHNTTVLERMIRQWGSEEKVWELVGELGDEEVFSDIFKKTRDVWRIMYEKKGDI